MEEIIQIDKDITLYTFDEEVYSSMKQEFFDALTDDNLNHPLFGPGEKGWYETLEFELRFLSEKILEGDFETWFVSKTIINSVFKLTLHENFGNFEARDTKMHLVNNYLKRLYSSNLRKRIIE